MKKTFLMTLMAASMLLFTGCGSNDFDVADGNGTNSTVNAEGYAFYNANTPLTVSQAGAHYEIKAQLLHNGQVAPEKTVNLLPFDSAYGTASSFVTVTGTDGYAIFDYVAPSSMPANGTETDVKMAYIDENNQSISTTLRLVYNAGQPSNPPVDTTNMVLMAAPTSIAVSRAGSETPIIVYLSNSSTQSPVVNQTIRAQWFNPNNGILSEYNLTTNANGQVVFDYIAPATLPSSDFNVTFEVANGTPAKTTNVEVKFPHCTLTNVMTPIKVTFDNEEKTIFADVVDSNHVGISGQKVSISAVTDPAFGNIISSSILTSGDNGRIKFTYVGPRDLAAVDGNSTTVTLQLVDTNITADVTIEFDKTEVNVSKPFPVIDNAQREINITQNSQNLIFEIRVLEQGTNAPYTQGNVKVKLPNNVADGVDVGRFNQYTVPVEPDGFARFNYTAPSDIKALIDANETNATFFFYHEDNPTKEVNSTVVYHLTSDYIPADYIISTSSDDGKQTMGLKELKQFTVYLKDDQGNAVKDENISKLIIKTKNSLVGKIKDDTGTDVETLTLTGADAISGKSFSIQTYTYSGLVPIEIHYEFTDANGIDTNRTSIMNVVVFSGPPTAMSIVYAGVDHNETTAKYIEKFVLTVTDTYNNPVNTQPYVAVGSMVEYAVDGSSTDGKRTETSPRLWHGRLDSNGTLEAIGGDKAQFEASTTGTFKYIDIDNDKLVVFGPGYTYEAQGKWDIESQDDTTLPLRDKYYGSTRDGMYFAVGHNHRQDLCANDGRQYVANMKANQYKLDETGHALLELEYDYHLTGKDIMVWANLTGFQADNNHTGRIGEAIKHTLRGGVDKDSGNAFVHDPEGGVTLEKNETKDVTFMIWHASTPEHYISGHFGYAVTSDSTCEATVLDSSNLYDARQCILPKGYAFVKFRLKAKTDKGCTFDIAKIRVAEEFRKSTW